MAKTHFETGGRGSGRTSRMILALPVDNTPTVVVHTQELSEHVRKLARDLRPDLRHPIRVRIVRDTRDCDHLRGELFVVDHALWDHVYPEVCDLLRACSRRPLEPRHPGTVDATIERDANGAIKSVTLPGHGWE